MPTVTLDANVVHDILQPRRRYKVVELIGLSEAGRVDLAVTTHIHDDIPRDPLAARLAELPALGVDSIPGLFLLDLSPLDGSTVLGSAEFWRRRGGPRGRRE